MTTAIRGLKNQSERPAAFINRENRSNSWTCKKNEYNADVYAWIPQGKERGIQVTTSRNGGTTCNIWDSDWKIHGKWDDGDTFHLINGTGTMEDYELTIDSSGEISLSKR